MLARNLGRPKGRYYIENIFNNFIELHGDRYYADDETIIGGIGKIGEHTVTFIVQNKGTNLQENIKRHFGMSYPESYRKANRLMKQAEKFRRPIVCLIDTPGAYCGVEAEVRGQSEAIASTLKQMFCLRVPIISGIIGEGAGSGALTLAIADRVFMQQNAIYSILSPEAFASILWKDVNRKNEALAKMKVTAKELLEDNIIDDILLEPNGGAHKDPEGAASILQQYIITQLNILKQQSPDKLIENRYNRYRVYGLYREEIKCEEVKGMWSRKR